MARGYDDIARAARDAQSHQNQMWQQTILAGQRTAGALLGVRRKLGAAAVAFVAGETARQSFMEFAADERRMTRLGINAGATTAQVKSAHKELFGIAQETAQTYDDVLKGAESVVRATGMALPEATKLTRSIAIANQALGASMEDTGKTAEIFMNTLKIPQEQVVQGFAAMAESTKQGKFEAKDLARYIPQLAADFAAIGITGVPAVAKMSTMLQIIHRQTGDAEHAANALRDMMTKMVTPETETRFEKFGIDLPGELNKVRRQGGDITAAFTDLVDKVLAEMARAEGLPISQRYSLVAKLFPEIDSRRAMSALGAMRGDTGKMLEVVKNATDATLMKDYARVMEDTDVNIKRMSNSWTEAKNSFGGMLANMNASLPVLDLVARGLDQVGKGAIVAKRGFDAVRDSPVPWREPGRALQDAAMAQERVSLEWNFGRAVQARIDLMKELAKIEQERAERVAQGKAPHVRLEYQRTELLEKSIPAADEKIEKIRRLQADHTANVKALNEAREKVDREAREGAKASPPRPGKLEGQLRLIDEERGRASARAIGVAPPEAPPAPEIAPQAGDVQAAIARTRQEIEKQYAVPRGRQGAEWKRSLDTNTQHLQKLEETLQTLTGEVPRGPVVPPPAPVTPMTEPQPAAPSATMPGGAPRTRMDAAPAAPIERPLLPVPPVPPAAAPAPPAPRMGSLNNMIQPASYRAGDGEFKETAQRYNNECCEGTHRDAQATQQALDDLELSGENDLGSATAQLQRATFEETEDIRKLIQRASISTGGEVGAGGAGTGALGALGAGGGAGEAGGGVGGTGGAGVSGDGAGAGAGGALGGGTGGGTPGAPTAPTGAAGTPAARTGRRGRGTGTTGTGEAPTGTTAPGDGTAAAGTPSAPGPGETAREAAVIDMISKREGATSPETVFGDPKGKAGQGKYAKAIFGDKPLTQHTVSEVLAKQRQLTQMTAAAGVAGGRGTSAVGSGQFIRSTLMGNLKRLGIPESEWGTTKFDANLQRRLTLQNFRDTVGDPNKPESWNRAKLGQQWESFDTRKGFKPLSEAELGAVNRASPTAGAQGTAAATVPAAPGAAVAGAGRVEEAQGRVAATRRGALDPQLRTALEYAAEQSGVNVRVTSGGQRMHGAEGATGSHRHDKGRAADLDVIDPKTGKTLELNDPRRLKFLEESAAAGAGGTGTRYMSDPKKIHAGITGASAEVGRGLGAYAGPPEERAAVSRGLSRMMTPEQVAAARRKQIAARTPAAVADTGGREGARPGPGQGAPEPPERPREQGGPAAAPKAEEPAPRIERPAPIELPNEHTIKVKYDLDSLPRVRERGESDARHRMDREMRSAEHHSLSDVGVA